MKSTSSNYTFLLISITIRHVFSLTFGIDVYKNIHECPDNRAGPPDCEIRYETCRDNKTRCFNKSTCYRSNIKDPLTNDFPYYCDCASATTESHFFAGNECEHSSTLICHRVVNKDQGSMFCTNGGSCVEMFYKGKKHGGCECPDDYAGAHCQYLKSDLAGKGLTSEALFLDVGQNFWAYVPVDKKVSKKITEVVVGVTLSAVGMITLAFIYMLFRRKQIVLGHEKRISMDPNVIEADGSRTMKADEIL